MRMRKTISLLAFAAALAACSAEAPKAPTPSTSGEPVREPVVAPREGPAGEVAPGSRDPVDAVATVAKPSMPEGIDGSWAVYFEKIPFEFGSKAGLAKAAETGKPMMMFYSATW